MKTIHHLIVPVTLSILATTAFADTAVVDGIEWTYEELDEEVCIGSDMGDSLAVPSSTAGAISVPSRLNGYPVTTIGGGAFSGCSGLTSITIPDSVRGIGSGAFHGCSSLLNPICNVSGSVLWFVPSSFHGSFSIPDGVTSIGNYAFEDCSGLTSVVIPDSVTSIGAGAFSGCSGLETITIPDSVTSIENWAFSGCSGLETITIPDSVTSIGVFAFFGCSGLTSVTIPDSVTSIEDGAFDGCSGLETITIPASVTSIEARAFDGCWSLSEVHISDLEAWCHINFDIDDGNGENSNPCNYSHRLFLNGEEVKTLVIPDDMTDIGWYAFSGCWGLSSVTANPKWGGRFRSATNFVFTIPDGVSRIDDFAFEFCRGLTSITIPDSVTWIGDEAFEGCSGLTSITIPKGVTSIGYSPFEGATGLETMYLPRRFEGRTGLMSIVPTCTIYFYGDIEALSVPDGWLSGFGLAGDDNIAAAEAVAANGVNKVWECYVAGLDPTNALSRFEARIDMEEGDPIVTWSPDLRPDRVYTVLGATTPGAKESAWTNVTTMPHLGQTDFRFFKVKVSLKEE